MSDTDAGQQILKSVEFPCLHFGEPLFAIGRKCYFQTIIPSIKAFDNQQIPQESGNLLQ